MHKKDDDSYKTIGVFSYQGHVGVTHLALLLASYFSSKRGKKVWYVEVGKQYTIRCISDVIKGRYVGKEGEFQADRITFFSNVSVEKGKKLLEATPDMVIMDFGVLTDEKEELLKKCQQRWLVCDCSLWKQEWLLGVLCRKKREEQKPWTRCLCFLGKRHVKRISSQTKEVIHVLPEMGNPFCIKRENLNQILSLFK